jgi:hypothetical protein
MNAAKARDRSLFETFTGWHQSLYRDVEATSVTPFASRARDKALHAALVTMIRHSSPAMNDKPDLANASDEQVQEIIDYMRTRVEHVDPGEADKANHEVYALLDDWQQRDPANYISVSKLERSLMQYAETYARRVAVGRIPARAWPTMNTMRSVEASTPFRLREFLTANLKSKESPEAKPADGSRPAPTWRRSK